MLPASPDRGHAACLPSVVSAYLVVVICIVVLVSTWGCSTGAGCGAGRKFVICGCGVGFVSTSLSLLSRPKAIMQTRISAPNPEDVDDDVSERLEHQDPWVKRRRERSKPMSATPSGSTTGGSGASSWNSAGSSFGVRLRWLTTRGRSSRSFMGTSWFG